MMTRETKVGIAVTCSFLCLVGVVYYMKKKEVTAQETNSSQPEMTQNSNLPAAPPSPPNGTGSDVNACVAKLEAAQKANEEAAKAVANDMLAVVQAGMEATPNPLLPPPGGFQPPPFGGFQPPPPAVGAPPPFSPGEPAVALAVEAIKSAALETVAATPTAASVPPIGALNAGSLPPLEAAIEDMVLVVKAGIQATNTSSPPPLPTNLSGGLPNPDLGLVRIGGSEAPPPPLPPVSVPGKETAGSPSLAPPLSPSPPPLASPPAISPPPIAVKPPDTPPLPPSSAPPNDPKPLTVTPAASGAVGASEFTPAPEPLVLTPPPSNASSASRLTPIPSTNEPPLVPAVPSPSSVPPLRTPSMPPTPPSPAVKSYNIMQDTVGPNETNITMLSQRLYGDAMYATALDAWMRNKSPLADQYQRQGLQPGQMFFWPDKDLLKLDAGLR